MSNYYQQSRSQRNSVDAGQVYPSTRRSYSSSQGLGPYSVQDQSLNAGYDSNGRIFESQTSPYDGDFDSPEATAPSYGNMSDQAARDRPRSETTPISRTFDDEDSQLPYSQEPESLAFGSLNINDPIPRTSSALSYGRSSMPFQTEPIVRSASTAPPATHRQPHHSNTAPLGFDPRAAPPGAPSRNDVRSFHSAGSVRTPGTGYERDMPAAYVGNRESSRLPTGPPNGGAYRTNSGPSMLYNQPPPQQYTLPPQQPAYNPLYDIASSVLGMPPPPPPQQQYPYPSQSQYPSNPSYPQSAQPNFPPQNPASLNRDNASISGYSSMSDPTRGPLPRNDSMVPGPPPGTSRPVTKVIDVNQPPYTKEYIDQYRNRLKGDPDPETHFGFAKYLIQAARKVGQHAKDQRAVRKYREALVAESLKVIRRLATQGETYPDAQFFLANCYGTGMLGLEVDHEKAYHMYLQASKNNHSQACYRVAVCNELGAGTKRDSGRAFAFYRKAATLGDTAAMYKLGMILLTGGLGQAKNSKDALIWLRRAAEQADEDNPHALHELGLIYEPRKDHNGLVVPDAEYAKELFTQAAQLGYTQSQFKLGSCYEYGHLGCPVDPKRSIAWYSKAAEKGDREAELAVSGWYLTGSEGVLQQKDSEAYLWARKAADKGLDKAEYAVGYYTEMGIGVKPDLESARRWYMRAAAQNNPRAMQRLTELKRGDTGKGRRARPTRQQANDEGCIIQ